MPCACKRPMFKRDKERRCELCGEIVDPVSIDDFLEWQTLFMDAAERAEFERVAMAHQALPPPSLAENDGVLLGLYGYVEHPEVARLIAQHNAQARDAAADARAWDEIEAEIARRDMTKREPAKAPSVRPAPMKETA